MFRRFRLNLFIYTIPCHWFIFFAKIRLENVILIAAMIEND